MSSQITVEELQESIDMVWVVVATFLVFIMQLGFAFLEAGTIRRKNINNICVCGIGWYLIGYGVAFGSSQGGFIGGSKEEFALSGLDQKPYFTSGTIKINSQIHFSFQWAFAGTAGTIVSGCIAERMPVKGYLIYSIYMTIFVYPIVCHWVWDGGWLSQTVDGHTIYGYGFNCGSTLSASSRSDQLTIGRILIATTLAASIGGTTQYIITEIQKQCVQTQTLKVTMGILAGLISITASCDQAEPWEAVIIGIIGALVYEACSYLILKWKIDDPLDASPLHLGCGTFGIFASAFIHKEEGVIYGGSGLMLVYTIAGVICVIIWSWANSYLAVIFLRKIDLIKVPNTTEIIGFDEGENEELERQILVAFEEEAFATFQNQGQRMILYFDNQKPQIAPLQNQPQQIELQDNPINVPDIRNGHDI